MEQLAQPWGSGYEQGQQQQQEPQPTMEQQLQVAQEECNELIKNTAGDETGAGHLEE